MHSKKTARANATAHPQNDCSLPKPAKTTRSPSPPGPLPPLSHSVPGRPCLDSKAHIKASLLALSLHPLPRLALRRSRLSCPRWLWECLLCLLQGWRRQWVCPLLGCRECPCLRHLQACKCMEAFPHHRLLASEDNTPLNSHSNNSHSISSLALLYSIVTCKYTILRFFVDIYSAVESCQINDTVTYYGIRVL